MYRKFHEKIEIGELQIKDTILGKKGTDDKEIAGVGDMLSNEQLRGEQVLEKVEIISKISDGIYDNYPLKTLHDILYTKK